MKIIDVIRATADHYGLTLAEMTEQNRQKHLVKPRQLACFIAEELCLGSRTQIGNVIHRDHTTVRHAVQAVSDRLAYELERGGELHDDIAEIKTALKKQEDKRTKKRAEPVFKSTRVNYSLA